MATYKALEYVSSIWSPLASSTSINKQQVMQNAALRTATGCTQDTNIQHMHDESLTLPIPEHLQIHTSQYNLKTQHRSHLLHKYTTYFKTPMQKNYISNNGRYTTNIPTDPNTVTTTDITTNMCHIHTTIVPMHLATRGNNKILRAPPPHTSSSEEILTLRICEPLFKPLVYIITRTFPNVDKYVILFLVPWNVVYSLSRRFTFSFLSVCKISATDTR